MGILTRSNINSLMGKYPQMDFHPGEKEENDQLEMAGRPVKQKSSSFGAGAAAAQRETAERAAQRQAQIDMINEQKNVQRGILKNNFDLQTGEARKRSDNNLKDIYVSYMKGIKGMPQQTALWGAGGAIESLKHRGQLNYENNRAKENDSYSAIMSQLQQRYNDELMSLEEKYLARLMNL